MVAQAYYDGYLKALDGNGRDMNPYRQTNNEAMRRSWDEGWQDAHDEQYISDR